MITDLWDIHGQAVAYIDDDKQSVYLRDGTPVAWLSEHALYTYRGKLLGWLWEGWVFGRDGKCVLFTEHAQPGAPKPFRQPPEDRGERTPRPSRDARETAQKRPGRVSVWSSKSAVLFFTR
jgi:hypothetical protein